MISNQSLHFIQGGAMGFLTWVIFGAIAGGIAQYLMPGKSGTGLFKTSILGIVGATVGGWFGTELGFGTVQGFDLRSFGVAIIGALIILVMYRILFGTKS